MKKIMIFLSAMAFIAFTYVNNSVFAEEVTPLLDKPVINIQGDRLGAVKSFVRDADGTVAFAIVSQRYLFGWRERKVAVPYKALTYDKEKEYFSCDISWDRFLMAPPFKDEEELRDRSFAEGIYRYFGQQPYWTEESTE